MKNRELNRQIQILESLFKRTVIACGDDLEIRSHWARYLCVLCAGFLENALGEVFSDFCLSAASGPVAQFASRTLKRTKNPKTTKFVEITGSFNKTWSENLLLFVEENGRKEAIDSIMANRHLIAHGSRSDVTIARIADYLKKSIEVVEFIENQCQNIV